jgi:hypothetical protein
MTAVLTPVNKLFDLLFRPFETLHPLWTFLVFALLTTLLVLGVFRWTSDPKKIRRAKDKIQAHVLEARLFQDQLGVVLGVYPGILRGSAEYLRHTMRSLIVMIVPLFFILVQLEMRLGRRPLRAGETVLVTARFAQPDALGSAALRVPEGLAVTAPPLRIPAEKEVNWRIRAEKDGRFEIEVQSGGEAFSRTVLVGERVAAAVPLRPRAVGDVLLNPGEPRLPAGGPLERIEVQYPLRELSFGLFEAHWLIPFLAASILAGYAVKGIFRVEF